MVLSESLALKLDVTCFTEGWLTEAIKHFVKFHGYHVFLSLKRAGLLEGGITVLFRCNFTIAEIPQCAMSTL